MKRYYTALTIAGSDSCGGAGIQADIKTMSALGVYASSAISAITVQNTTGVFGIQKIEPEIVSGQIEAVMDDIHPQAIKIGMVNDGETRIEYLLVVDRFENKLTPCGKCCELMTQINENNGECVVFVENAEKVLLRDIYRIDWKRIKASGCSRPISDKYNIKRF